MPGELESDRDLQPKGASNVADNYSLLVRDPQGKIVTGMGMSAEGEAPSSPTVKVRSRAWSCREPAFGFRTLRVRRRP